VAYRHRLQIGTIFSISGLQILNKRGKRLGTVEEFFISKLKEGDCFNFSGKTLMITKIEAHAVRVQDAPAGAKALTPAWMGGRLSFSSEVTEQLLTVLQNLDVLIPEYPELQLMQPMLDKQLELSQIPGRGKVLVEITQSKEGTHLFVFPFEGRRVNEAVAMLLAYRIGKVSPNTFSVSCNDYGFELFTDKEFAISKELLLQCLTPKNLSADLLATHNYHELLKKRFTEISTVAGMLHKDHPDAPVKQRHLQNSAALLFKVLQDFEPHHILLRQAADEVSLHFMEELRIRLLLQKIEKEGIDLIPCNTFTPFSFPLMAEGLREKLSTEKLEARLERILKKLGV
jgi:ATP-dependent Lhr-like helicase